MYNGLPVVGILSVYDNVYDAYGVSSAYVDWIKTAGCHVIYILGSMSYVTLRHIFDQIDCFIIPGGSIHATQENETYRKAMYILNLAKKKKGFPVVGICMGMQYMLSYFSKNEWFDMRSMVYSLSQAKPFKTVNETKGTILETSTSHISSTHMYYNHYECLTYETFKKDRSLVNNLETLTTTHSRTGDPHYVSTIQGKELPWFGFQWHVERPEFETNHNKKIPRTPSHFMVARNMQEEYRAKHQVLYCLVME